MRNLITGVVLLCVPAASAFAADRIVGAGGPFETVQSAVDAAQTGDRVVINRGVYRENVVVAVSGISIVGKPGAVLDGTTDLGFRGICLAIDGTDVSVSGLAFRSADTFIDARADGTRITSCTGRNASGNGFVIIGGSGTVTNCTVRGVSGSGIQVSGAGATVTSCTVSGVSSSGIVINGTPDAQAVSNTVRNVGGIGIFVSGQGAIVSKNSVTGTGSRGLDVDADDAVVSANRVTNADSTLIDVSGDRCRVTGNSAANSSGTAVTVTGDAMTVTSNRASQVYNDEDGFSFRSRSETGGGTVEGNVVVAIVQYGFDIGTSNVTYRKNVATRCGSEDEAGFLVGGTANVLEECSAIDSDSSAFFVTGDAQVLRRCRAVRASNAGFAIAGTDAVIEDCTAGGTTIGVGNGGTRTTLTRGVFVKNRFDICRNDSGTWAAVNGPRFTTGGQDTVFSQF